MKHWREMGELCDFEKAFPQQWEGYFWNLDPEKGGKQLDVEKWLEDHMI